MIAVGAFRIVVLGEGATYGPTIAGQLQDTAQPITILLLLRAFAAGAVALTGTEAIATGVPAFKPPEAKNAAPTLGGDGRPPRRPVHRDHVPGRQLRDPPDRLPREADGHRAGRPPGVRRRRPVLPVPGLHRDCCCSWPRTPASTPSRACWRSWPATATCRASSRCAATGWPSPTGSSSLASLAAGLIVIFGGSTHLLIPLYAVGVFIDFTISQTGMIRHWLRERSPG